MGSKYCLLFWIVLLIGLTSCKDGQVSSYSEMDDVAGTETGMFPDLSEKTPSETFTDVVRLFAAVEKMELTELEGLNGVQLWNLSEPLIILMNNTISLNDPVLFALQEPVQKMADLSHAQQLTKDVHTELTDGIRRILNSNKDLVRVRTGAMSEQVHKLILDWARDQSKGMVCEKLFNVTGDSVVLMPGDNFDVANYYCPEGTFFYITDGTYDEQSVSSPKNGNHWVGAGADTVFLDGLNSTNAAFSGQMIENLYSHFEIRNYREFGIASLDKKGSEKVIISNISFRNIARTLTGQKYGAVMAEWMKDLMIKDSYFENVSSAIRFINSEGPLQVLNNKSVNPGRNFFQCDKCNGGGIRINNNSMEHLHRYGTELLEDYINIFQSEGEADDWIQVNNNRARGHGGSASGSFLILGDAGGKYQEAVGNIGVNPGQAGIGIASGEFIKAEGNIMYSEPWGKSNVAFYSADFGYSCASHIFPGPHSSKPNTANWRNSEGVLNKAWTS
jgi:hypothetical protein